MAPRRVQFLAKSHYFTGTGFKGALSRAFFTAIGAVGVERGAGQAAQEALDQSKRILDTGAAFALYPEGTRSLDGRLYKGRTGIAWLALTTGAPVVPVGLIGTERAAAGRHEGAARPADHGHVRQADRPRRTTAARTPGRARRQATDEVMAAIHALTGQELANKYNEAPPVDDGRTRQAGIPHERL